MVVGGGEAFSVSCQWNKIGEKSKTVIQNKIALSSERYYQSLGPITLQSLNQETRKGCLQRNYIRQM